jgi:hypothetical protein
VASERLSGDARRGYEVPRSRGSRPRRVAVGAILAFVTIASVVAVKVANYAAPAAIRPAAAIRAESHVRTTLAGWYHRSHAPPSCPRGLRLRDVSGGYVCSDGDSDVFARIFDTYPQLSGADQTVYAAISDGSIAIADGILQGRFAIPRFRPVAIPADELWRADPYHAGYWHFYYYSLRPTTSLLIAYEKTGRRAYLERLLGLLGDFVVSEPSSRIAWSDAHSVAFRGLVLTYEWWELRRLHALLPSASRALLAEISKTADFLADRNHYQPEMNHGTNESAALLEIAAEFPTLPHASRWRSIARLRLAESLDLLFDGDGVLIENSPYYHFYELDKYWQIYRFTTRRNIPISTHFASRLRDMTTYATYILQPNSAVPLLGASLDATIDDGGSFSALAAGSAEFRYVLTHGRSGVRPSRTSVAFPDSGQTVMRSDWTPGDAFTKSTYATFNVGAYRTRHSDLDALGFTLYGEGRALLPGPGLYTYQEGPMRDYFHGTASHNTVVIDGRSQEQGSATAGPLVTRDGITYQSGVASLYDGVTQRRLLMMIDRHHVLVVDRLDSAATHTYSQVFHLFPGARLAREGLSVFGFARTSNQAISITQLDPYRTSVSTVIGQLSPPAGLCSGAYEKATGCYEVTYTQRGTHAEFTTLLTIGRPDSRFRIALDRTAERVEVTDHGRRVSIALAIRAGRLGSAFVEAPPAPTARGRALAWTSRWVRVEPGGGLATHRGALPLAGEPRLTLTARSRVAAAVAAVRANLRSANLLVHMRVTGAPRVRSLTLTLSNGDFRESRSISLADAYPARFDREWLTVSLGRGSSITALPGYWSGGRPFSWRRVDGIRLEVVRRGGAGPPPTVEIARIRAEPQPAHGAVALIFDDGYDSVLPAAAVLHQYGMPGTVAVIGKYAELPTFHYLNIFELRSLQDEWGWNIVNHTQLHVDAVANYGRRDKYGAYEQDILGGAEFLERAGLNSAPNWLVYPHGTTDSALSAVAGRFYKFARTTDRGPEAYPFGSPLRVKTLEVMGHGDGGDVGSTGENMVTSPQTVIEAAPA